MAYREYFVHIRVNLDEGDESAFPGIAYDPDFVDNATITDMKDIVRNLGTSDFLDFYDASDITVKPV